MAEITLIAAIGQRGQLGLNGDMPWGRTDPEDLKRFREVTTGGVVIVGFRTWASMNHLVGTARRLFVEDNIIEGPVEAGLEQMRQLGREIFIAGGAKTYRRWMPHITKFDVTLVPYDGEADVWADFLLPHVTRTL